jgi:hypothetical protein
MATTIIGIELDRSLVIKRLIKSWPFLGLVATNLLAICSKVLRIEVSNHKFSFFKYKLINIMEPVKGRNVNSIV